LAKAVGIHANTVRLYEEWGLIPPAERSPSGYRRFTSFHLDCLRLARTVYSAGFPGRAILRSGVEVSRTAASGDLNGALESARRHFNLVRAEQAQADSAAGLLDRWAASGKAQSLLRPLHIAPASKSLGVSIDILRNWERNGLLPVPRDPKNGYRLYGPSEMARARMIRLLSRAGYSVMAILRMLIQLDAGRTEGLRTVLDTPRPDEDVFSASDRWLTTLAEHNKSARRMILLLKAMIRKHRGPA
jgi:DNA-binding transcriptional MerR regulator